MAAHLLRRLNQDPAREEGLRPPNSEGRGPGDVQHADRRGGNGHSISAFPTTETRGGGNSASSLMPSSHCFRALKGPKAVGGGHQRRGGVGLRVVRAHRGRPAGPVALHGLVPLMASSKAELGACGARAPSSALSLRGTSTWGTTRMAGSTVEEPTGARTAGSSGSTRSKREREVSVGEAEAGEQRKGRRRSGCHPFRETCAWAVFVCLCYFSVMNMSSWKIPGLSFVDICVYIYIYICNIIVK